MLPIRCGSKSHASSPVARRIQLTYDRPDKRAPCSGESSDKEAGEDDHDVTSLGRTLRVEMVKLVLTDKGVDEQAHEHPRGSSHQSLAATDVLYDPETHYSSCDIDCAKNDGGDVAVG